MDFFSAIKMECYKSTKRKTARLLLFFMALPLFYGVAYASGSSVVTLGGHFTAVSFCSSCWMLLGYTGMTGILFVIVTANYFGKEKEDGQIKFLFLTNRKREEVFLAKYVSVLLLSILSYLAMYMITTGVFYICIVQTTSKGILCDGINDFITSITSDIIVLIQIVMIVNIEVMLCMYCKSSFCILAGVGVSFGFTVLQAVPVIKFGDPMYIMNLYNEAEISTLGVWIYSAIYLLVSAVPITIGMKKFQRSELK